MKKLTFKRAISGARWAMYKLQARALTLGSNLAQTPLSRRLSAPLMGATLMAAGCLSLTVGVSAAKSFIWALSELSAMRQKGEQASVLYDLMSTFALAAPLASAMFLIVSVFFIGLGAAMLSSWKKDPVKLGARALLAEGLARSSVERDEIGARLGRTGLGVKSKRQGRRL